ncbi:aminotransferase class I/II-fold pyridoxal phosphate-dependent enzyme [Gleimia sp. 6138-11-ORH1]|uniref:MalY/PatB family protein n=1 Tax=Gleimia sp. 6138-11-ORH1 TaxID=2973937 RepID=UPI002168D01E|nr:aminotransferase class I/II-fold pyridoxal phosphate-dependent enzyme [Gleimia sp. 6138-11-ORH1]MCS4484863.1 aminotransferase class I/II-fold pyridoxal phosphate-dependent enzyme [Gleimia sp. 6138-11-ORH1]
MRSFDDYSAESMRALRTMKWSVPTFVEHIKAPPLRGHWVAEMDFQPCPEVAAALHETVESGYTGYPPCWLKDQMVRAAAQFYKAQYDWEVYPRWITPIMSVLDAFRAFLHMLPANSQVIVPTPAYMPFLTSPQQVGHTVVEVPARYTRTGHALSWELDFAAIETAATQGAAGLVLCNPWNPTGRALTLEELKKVSELAQKYGFLVFADEIHAPLVLAGTKHIPYLTVAPQNQHHTIAATAASKGFNVAGLHCAQAIVSPDSELYPQWERLSYVLGWAAPLGLKSTIAAYTRAGTWLTNVRDYLADNLLQADQLFAKFNAEGGDLAWQLPQAGYLGFLRFPTDMGLAKNESLAESLYRETGVLTNPGETLGADYPNYVRFNFASSRVVVEESLELVLDFVKKHS